MKTATGLWLAGCVLCSLLVACRGSAATMPDGGACDAAAYPCGPYGYTPGSVIEDVTLTGRRNLSGDGMVLTNPVIPIHFSDYHQDNRFQVLVLAMAATWCAPCVNEQPALNQLYDGYQAAGGYVALLEGILQDTSGGPAPLSAVDAWALAYKTPFDIAADPAEALRPYYDPKVFPVQMVISTKTMTIAYYHVGGGADTELKAAIDQTLATR
jgi:hypothetical protein